MEARITENGLQYALLTYARPTSFSSEISFEIQIRKRRPISISKEVSLENEDGRAYYHTWEERIVKYIQKITSEAARVTLSQKCNNRKSDSGINLALLREVVYSSFGLIL